MIIAIASNNDSLDTLVSPYFGRCEWFYIINLKYNTAEFIRNPILGRVESTGLDTVDFLMLYNVDLVIAGRFGSKVIDYLRKNNIQMVIPQSGKKMSEIINLLNFTE